MIRLCRRVRTMVIDENWGISIERIRDFFARQPDAVQTAQGFSFPDCSVRLSPLPGKTMGKWDMPRTRVQMEGSETAVREIHRRFFLRFLSAGG